MDIVTFIKSFPLKTLARDETLVESGDTSDTLYAIQEGYIKVTTIDEVGRRKLLWIAGRYDFIPIELLFSKQPTKYFYSAFNICSVYMVRKDSFLKYTQDNPKALQQIARGLSEHHDDLLDRMNAVGQSDLRLKLLFIMHNLCTKFSQSEVVHLHEIGLNLTHQDLADMVGSTREAVSIELSNLRKEGVIDYTRSTFTVFYEKLSKIIEAPI